MGIGLVEPSSFAVGMAVELRDVRFYVQQRCAVDHIDIRYFENSVLDSQEPHPFSHAVGAGGCVLAVDLQPDMLAILREKVKSPGSPQNVQLLQGTAEQTGISERSCDLVFLANIWHELDDHAAVLREAGRILKMDGLIAILDWRRDLTGPPGPPADHRIAEAETVSELAKVGTQIRRSGAFGRYSYLVVGTRPNPTL